VTVGRTRRHRSNASIAAGTGPILHDERLTEFFLELFGNESREHVSRSTCWIRHDDLHDPVGPIAAILRVTVERQGSIRGGAAKRHDKFATSHVSSRRFPQPFARLLFWRFPNHTTAFEE
jgi:hypothetical protein